MLFVFVNCFIYLFFYTLFYRLFALMILYCHNMMQMNKDGLKEFIWKNIYTTSVLGLLMQFRSWYVNIYSMYKVKRK